MSNSEKLSAILEVCKEHLHLMWAAKIVAIILECDFRDCTQKINEQEND